MKVLKSFFAIMLVFSVIAPVGSAEVPGVNRSMKQGATKVPCVCVTPFSS
ncbi:hypothetical protein OC195_11575 [Priestia flexa]|nr:hypothetical protein OC195_11575 [Priestia flexa]